MLYQSLKAQNKVTPYSLDVLVVGIGFYPNLKDSPESEKSRSALPAALKGARRFAEQVFEFSIHTGLPTTVDILSISEEPLSIQPRVSIDKISEVTKEQIKSYGNSKDIQKKVNDWITQTGDFEDTVRIVYLAGLTSNGESLLDPTSDADTLQIFCKYSKMAKDLEKTHPKAGFILVDHFTADAASNKNPYDNSLDPIFRITGSPKLDWYLPELREISPFACHIISQFSVSPKVTGSMKNDDIIHRLKSLGTRAEKELSDYPNWSGVPMGVQTLIKLPASHEKSGIFQYIKKFFSIKLGNAGLKLEARDDWKLVRNNCHLLEAKLKYLKGPYDSAERQIRLERVHGAAEFLKNAEQAYRISDIWGYINRADALLVQAVCDDSDVALIANRLRNLRPSLKTVLEDLESPEIKVPSENDNPDVSLLDYPYGDTQTKYPQDCNLQNANIIHRELLTYGQLWNSANQVLDFNIKVWSRRYQILFCFLLTILLISDGILHGSLIKKVISDLSLHGFLIKHWSPINILGDDNPKSYILAAMFGGFGAALSALLKSQDLNFNATNYPVQSIRLRVRLLLGGCGAYIVYLASRAGVLSSEFNLDTSFAIFAIICILAGFSERMFVGVFEKIKGVDPVSKPPKNS
jgi:hypothetical protein